MAGPNSASVVHVRSADHNVFLSIGNGPQGWALLDDAFAHGIAAACQAAKQPVWMKYNTFEPNGGPGGSGMFTGVQLAVEPF
jgi:hypothetical protein